MKIIKLGHCCLLIEESGLRILTDPGSYSTAQDEIAGIDIILITHEHADHIHIESLKNILKNNPSVKIYTNSSVGKLLEKEGIRYELLEDKQRKIIKNIAIEGCGDKHAEIHPSFPGVQNTGYLINEKFFHPGDSLYDPKRKVEILALPVAGPWLKISEAIDYAERLKPKVCFPIHDGALKIYGGNHKVPEIILPKKGIKFVVLEIGKETEL